MFEEKNRIKSYLTMSIDEISLIEQMSTPIKKADDFVLDINGMTIFRACSMSLQYITENLVQVRNRVQEPFFAKYKKVPWKAVFGMRNFLAHEYGEVDSEAVFNTIQKDMPILKETIIQIVTDLNSGNLDKYIVEK